MSKTKMESATRGERIRSLRELLGLTQDQLAERVGIARSYLSLMENGARPTSDVVVQQISEATRMPTSFFDVTGPDDNRGLNYRRLATTTAAARDAVTRRFKEVERIAGELTDLAEYPVADLPVAQDDINGDDIEDLAASTRQALILEPFDPIGNLTRAMERAGIALAPLVPDGDPGDLMSGHDGICRLDPDRFRPVIGYAPDKSGDRDRFTKAHELGHWVLHRERAWVVEKVREREASRFAGALLFPRTCAEDAISDQLSLNGYLALKAEWGMSIAAIVMRGKHLDLLSDKRYKSLMIQISAKGWRKNEPVTVEPEKPVLLWQLLSNHFGPTPYMKASVRLGITPELLRAWIPEGKYHGPVRNTYSHTRGTENSKVVNLFSSRS